MKVLLASMPDAVSAFDNLVAFPNTGLCSIAGNLEGCEVRILDLVAFRLRVEKTLRKHLNAFRPGLVGLSAMTFQYDSAVRVARIVREWDPDVPIALGGYHGSLSCEEIGSSPQAGLFDFVIRGEGERAFAGLVGLWAGAAKEGFPTFPAFRSRTRGSSCTIPWDPFWT